MKPGALFLLVAGAVLAGCSGERSGGVEELVLAQNGVAGYEVATPDDPVPGDAFAVADLTNLLFRASGARFAVVRRGEKAARKRIFLGIAPDGAPEPEEGGDDNV